MRARFYYTHASYTPQIRDLGTAMLCPTSVVTLAIAIGLAANCICEHVVVQQTTLNATEISTITQMVTDTDADTETAHDPRARIAGWLMFVCGGVSCGMCVLLISACTCCKEKKVAPNYEYHDPNNFV